MMFTLTMCIAIVNSNSIFEDVGSNPRLRTVQTIISGVYYFIYAELLKVKFLPDLAVRLIFYLISMIITNS